MATDESDALKEDVSELVFVVCYQLYLYFLNCKSVGSVKFDDIASQNKLIQAISNVLLPRPPTHSTPATADLDTVVSAFGHLITEEETTELYREFCRLTTVDGQLYEAYRAEVEKNSLLEFYVKVNGTKRQCPVFVGLARVVCQVKASQAGVERGFSNLALFKSRTTCSLSPATTEARFIIANNLPKIYTEPWDDHYFDDFKASHVHNAFVSTEARSFAPKFI